MPWSSLSLSLFWFGIVVVIIAIVTNLDRQFYGFHQLLLNAIKVELEDRDIYRSKKYDKPININGKRIIKKNQASCINCNTPAPSQSMEKKIDLPEMKSTYIEQMAS